MDKKKEADTLLIYYKHAAPVEIGDFTKSLNGLCGYFSSYAISKGVYDAAPKLYVHKVKEGSIEVFLKLAESAVLPFVENSNIIMDFVQHFRDIKDYFCSGKGEKPILTKADYDSIYDAMAVTAKDAQGLMSIQAMDSSSVVFENCTFNLNDSNCLQNRASVEKKELTASPEIIQTAYSNCVLTICQAKSDIASKTGNKGKIDELFDGKPLPLLFATPDLKQQMLMEEGTNPFTRAFSVDVEIKKANGKPLYYITALHDVVGID